MKKTVKPASRYVGKLPTGKQTGTKGAPARFRAGLTPGDSVRIIRELQEMTQEQLAKASGIPQPTISAIEKGRATLGAERAEKLARALKVHPAVLLWPNWDEQTESKLEGAKRTGQRSR